MPLVRATLLLPLLAAALPASDSAWTHRASLSAGLAYDDNVFLQDRAPVLVPGAVPDRAGSWVGTLSVSLGLGWEPSDAFQLDAGYSPGITRYEAFDSEDHDDHRFDLGLRGHGGDWSYQLKGGFTLVDGSSQAPVYGHAGGGPAIGGAPVRARRDQTSARLAASLTRNFDRGFLRAAGAGNWQDFDTRHSAAAGHANYVDRSEWTAGPEAGLRIRQDFALIAALRAGEQRQANLLGVPLNYTNTLLRFLVGVEGKAAPGLTLRFLAGPDFRRYDADVAAGFDRTRTARYLEGSATWSVSDADTLALAFKDYLWLSSGGRGAYQNTTANLKWTHAIAAGWSASLAADVQVGDNRDYVVPASDRCDWIYTGTAGVTRAFNARTKLELELAREWSDSVVPAKPGREYTRWLVSANLRHAF